MTNDGNDMTAMTANGPKKRRKRPAMTSLLLTIGQKAENDEGNDEGPKKASVTMASIVCQCVLMTKAYWRGYYCYYCVY